jgi:thiol:disulfide interchange protein DsbC
MNSRFPVLIAAVVVGASLGAQVRATEPKPAPPPPATKTAAAPAPAPAMDERAALAKSIGAQAEELRPTAIKGIYEFVRGPNIAYVTADGKYFFFGDLYERDTDRNITEARRGEIWLKAINEAVPESEMLVFGPANARHTVTVFTDIDCGFCRQLHQDVPELNRKGVRVRYVFFPRTGPGTESWRKAEAVWCSPDRNAAFTRAKLGQDVRAKACGATPIRRQYELARELGVSGTPGIFTDRGHYLSGYRQPAQLLQELDAP